MGIAIPVSDQRRPTRRQLQAAQTRRDILLSARRLFVSPGYAQTSVNDLAQDTGVAVQTIYSSIGPKPAIVLALVDLIDEEAGLQELLSQATAESDPRRILAWAVRIPFRFVERCGDIVAAMLSAAAVEPEVAAALQEGWRRHNEECRRMARKLHAAGALASGVTLESAHAAIAVLTWHATQLQVRNAFGWNDQRREVWTVKVLTDALLGGGPPPSFDDPHLVRRPRVAG